MLDFKVEAKVANRPNPDVRDAPSTIVRKKCLSGRSTIWLFMSESDRQGQSNALQARFLCGACGAVAATVSCVPAGTTFPDPILGNVSDKSSWLAIEGFLGTHGNALKGREAAVLDALTCSSAKQLYACHPLWAPFYCSECDESYCENCWDSWIVMDDEDPGWYDCTNARCPKGHVRRIDD